MTLPAYRQTIDQALRDLSMQRATFPSQSRLIAHLAVMTDISTSTVYRYVRTQAVDRLIDAECHVTFTCNSPDTQAEIPASPPVSEVNKTPGQSTDTGSPLASAHTRPYISPSGVSSSPPPTPSPSSRPLVGGLDAPYVDPFMGRLSLSHGVRRAGRRQNDRDAWCLACGDEVLAGWGWHTVPFIPPCPVHCESCWSVLDASERDLLSPQGAPSEVVGRAPPDDLFPDHSSHQPTRGDDR